MSYSHRTKLEQLRINIKVDLNNLKQKVDEFLYSHGLKQAPEVDWTLALPTPEEVAN